MSKRWEESKIYFLHIIRNHRETFRLSNGRFRKADKRTFLYFPIIFSIILTVCISIPNEKMVDIITIALSVFVGLFLNLLVLLLSSTKTNDKIVDKKGRKILLDHTYKNVSFAVLLGILTLVLILLISISPFPEDLKFCVCEDPIFINSIYQGILALVIYFFVIQIFITLLMILKRIYKLFSVDIETSE